MVSHLVFVLWFKGLFYLLRHHEAAYVFGHPDGYLALNLTVGSPYQKQLSVHHKYLRQYKELMSKLSAEDLKKFTKWD